MTPKSRLGIESLSDRYKTPVYMGDKALVKIKDVEFNLDVVTQWAIDHPGPLAVLVTILFVFWIFGPGGFAGKCLDYRLKNKELDKKTELTRESLSLKYRNGQDGGQSVKQTPPKLPSPPRRIGISSRVARSKSRRLR